MKYNKPSSEETIILVSSNRTEPSLPPKDFDELSPYVYGGIAVAVIIALTAYSKSQMKSINELVKTLLKQDRNN